MPSLWPFEVGNVLGLKAPATSGALLQAMYDLGMAEESPHRDVVAILSLMREFEVTFYAAAYHALAIRRGGVLVTADRAYVTKAGRAGHVILLGDWRAPQ